MTDARWGLAGITSGELIASGALSLDANATYNFTATGTVDSGPVSIFTRTYTAIYDVGIPVVQVTTLSLEAEATATATAAVSAGADAKASTTAKVGVMYDRGSNAWQPVQSLSLTNSFTAHLDVNGSVQGEVRITPKLSVQFWELIVDVTGALSIEPSAGGTIGAQGTLIPPCVPLELTTFDFALGVDCFASADFRVFRHDYPLVNNLRVCGPLSYPLFSLPQFSLMQSGSGTDDDPFVITATPSDGVNDPFDATSAQWTALPDGAATLTVEPGNLAATITCNQAGPLTVTFAGNGRLGPIGLYCGEVDLTCSSPTPTPTDTPPDTPTPTSTPTPTPTPTPTATGPTATATPASCFTDNGDGTISDHCTGLMWEKKDQAGGLDDVNNSYEWSGYCSDGSGYCQPDADSASTCSAATGGAYGCTLCGGTATCDLYYGVPTIWQWLNQLNSAGFGGHSDWRIPTSGGCPAGSPVWCEPAGYPSGQPAELESILAALYPNCTTDPCVSAVFNNNCTSGCSVANCSCTQSDRYWSASTYAGGPYDAWLVYFYVGLVYDFNEGTKDSLKYVRAVRGGL